MTANVSTEMKPPSEDIEDRSIIWDYMQNFWMDTDPEILLPKVAQICSESKYSLNELEEIFWNEVKPAVEFNMACLPAPEWEGFEIEWLKQRVLDKHTYRKRLPRKWLHPYSKGWWKKLSSEITELENKKTKY